MSRATPALVAPAIGQLKLDNIHLDTLRPDEVLVKIHAVGICHADISCMRGIIPVKFPIVLGHEGAGTVLEVGDAVGGEIAPGDKVLLSFNSCRVCTTCNAGSPAYCENMLPLNFGGTRLDGSMPMRLQDGTPLHGNFFGQSSFSQLAIVSSASLVQVHEALPLDLLAPLGCGMQTGAGAVFNTLNVEADTSIVVFGTGAVGMAAIMAATIRGAHPIIGVDVVVDRLPIARDLGATHVLCYNDVEIVSHIKAICQGKGALNAVDTTGKPSVIAQMMNSLGCHGKGVSIGAPSPGTTVAVDIFSQITMGKRYIGCNQGDSIPQKMIPLLVQEHLQGRFPLDKIVKNYEIQDFAKAIDDMSSGRTIKPVLVWPE
ncbi:chaperonin 10-like protein [Aspergillus keveii]|uniref:Chaperonin 10-like protein n=1 Tax=Aspergillus keveii TaxID=714993 RepID=A0ABR4FS85_9EURO